MPSAHVLSRRARLAALARVLLLPVAAALLPLHAVAQTAPAAFPAKPVRILTPFPAGSGPDAALRSLADVLSRGWGQAVIVDNRPGGNGFIAINALKAAPGEGYDLIALDNTALTTHPHTFRHLPYDPVRDLVPVRMTFRTPFFVVVGKDSPFRSLDDSIAAARVKPDAVNYGSWGTGSPGHLGAVRLQQMKNVQMLHVPYRDFGQLFQAVAVGDVQWSMGSIASAGPLERSGRLRFLALAAPQRDPAYPNVPATSEIPDFKGFEVSSWMGIFTGPKTSAAVRDKLSADVAAALASPEVTASYKTLGYTIPDIHGAQFVNRIETESASWGETIRRANITLD